MSAHARPTQILLVEDNSGDAVTIEELLEERSPLLGEVDLIHVTSMTEFHGAVDGGLLADCVLLDLGLPDTTGQEVLDRAFAVLADVPVIVLTGDTNSIAAEAALAAGAQDFLIKSGNLTSDTVRRTIRYALERASQTRELRASRRELRDFAWQVAHDIRGPLSSVIGLLSLLDKGLPDDKVDEVVATALASGRGLQDLVGQLLEYAEAAGEEGMLGPVDLPGVLDWVRDTLGSRLDDVTLAEGFDATVVRGNTTAMRHVVLNLVDNAVRYAHRDRACAITVTSRVAGRRVLVDVSDNGVGIPQDQRGQVFAKGSRATSSGDGTGLGLATVYRTVTLFGGQVSVVDPESGVGATIRLDLPRG